MTAILTSYWTQTVALFVAFGLLAVKMICKAEDATVDAIVGLLIAYAIGSTTAKVVQERKAAAKPPEGNANVPQ